MTPLALAIIGGGYWGTTLRRVFGAAANVSVRGVCEPDASRRAAIAAGTTVFESVEEVLARDDVEAVAIATPPATHYDLAAAALRAGKHCWVEKPLSLRAGDARRLVDAARLAGRTLFVDETFLYDPLVQQAKQWIDTGRLGRLYHLSFERLGPGRIRNDSDVWWNSAPHDLAILRYLVPEPVEHLRVERAAYVQAGIADVATATACFRSGISAHIYVSWLAPLRVASLTVVGSTGMLHYQGRFGQRALQRFEYEVTQPPTEHDNVLPIAKFAAAETVHGGAEEPLARAVQAFVRAVRSGAPAPSSGEHSLAVVELLERGSAAF
jgi:predicted dehydrogenase